MGSAVSEHFDFFWGECQRTARAYQTMYEFYLHDGIRTIPLLNKLAPGLFSEMLETYLERIHLGIARLTDPKETKSARNLSADGVAKMLSDAGYEVEILQHLSDALLRIRETHGIKELRNKHIAHLDFDVVTNGVALKRPSIEALNEFFVLLQLFVETASETLGRDITEPVFDQVTGGYGERLFDWLDLLGFEDIPPSDLKHKRQVSRPPCLREMRIIR